MAVPVADPFDQSLGSSLMTVLGCLGRLRSAVVYFYMVVDGDIYEKDLGKCQQNLGVSLFLQQCIVDLTLRL